MFYILNYLENNEKDEIFEEIHYYLEHIHFMKFFAYSFNNREENIKLYDPIFSFFCNKIKEDCSVLYVNAKFDPSIDNFKFIEKRFIKMYEGYAKFYFDGKSFDWREIRTTNELTERQIVNFLCLNKNSNLLVR